MHGLRTAAALAAAVLGLASASAAGAVTVFTTTTTITNDINGSNISGGSIAGSFGSRQFSNGIDEIFSTIHVTVNDQGQAFDYDFSYDCRVGTPGCTTAPNVPTQYPGGSGHVGYTINTGEIPGALFPKLGQTTSAEADVHTSISDFVFVSTGIGHAVQTFSFMDAAPEPAQWALMLAGFGAAGVALRRRDRTLRAA